eukprot:Sspe_Gene.100683::Locus_75353_Transcript_1_1_Confidence_1.000_Length_1767::g.100683::m.100683/K08658/RCE1, FACE2; prenyl protein peptidase
MVTQTGGLLFVSGASAVFVGSMYLWPEARRPGYDRDAAKNIRRRALSAAGSVVATWLMMGRIVPYKADQLLGVDIDWGTQVRAAATCVGTTLLLFAGVVQEHIEGHGVSADSVRSLAGLLRRAVLPPADNWKAARNLVISPVAEELVFRVAFLHVLKEAGYGTLGCVGISSVMFALAHVHHFYFLLTAAGCSRTVALSNTLAALVLHSVFALYGAFLYIRTGSVVGACLVHSFCNLVGPPSLDFLNCPDPPRTRIGVAYIAGIAGFFGAVAYFLDPAVTKSWFYR